MGQKYSRLINTIEKPGQVYTDIAQELDALRSLANTFALLPIGDKWSLKPIDWAEEDITRLRILKDYIDALQTQVGELFTDAQALRAEILRVQALPPEEFAKLATDKKRELGLL